jgi:Xaa-Pro aminopeptidase
MFNVVLAGQRLGLRMVRGGASVRDIHGAIHELFASRGFETGRIGGRMQGFFHGTGHGLGLEIHEPPRIGDGPGVLRSGMVVTVEPGLYYYPVGGVRIEDTVLVTGHGVRNLTRFSKYLEIP